MAEFCIVTRPFSVKSDRVTMRKPMVNDLKV